MDFILIRVKDELFRYFESFFFLIYFKEVIENNVVLFNVAFCGFFEVKQVSVNKLFELFLRNMMLK